MLQAGNAQIFWLLLYQVHILDIQDVPYPWRFVPSLGVSGATEICFFGLAWARRVLREWPVESLRVFDRKSLLDLFHYNPKPSDTGALNPKPRSREKERITGLPLLVAASVGGAALRLPGRTTIGKRP